MTPYFVYILRCQDGTLYTGITTHLERRIQEHNTSPLGARYTKSRRPVELVYKRKYKNRSEASKQEAVIKKLTRKQKLELLSRGLG